MTKYNTITEHDKKEIQKLKEFKEWILWYRTLTEEEKEKLKYSRWRESD